MKNLELKGKVVPWMKSLTEDVDSRVASLQFTSEHLGLCRQRRHNYVPRPILAAIFGFVLFLFIFSGVWNLIDLQIFELDSKFLYKFVKAASGMIRDRKDAS